MEQLEDEPPTWWTVEEEYTLAVSWYGTSKNPMPGNNMRKVGFWEAMIRKFQRILKKDANYRIHDMLSSKWTQINKKCTKFNSIYNKISSHKQSGVTDFDVYRATMDQYHVETGHVFELEKIWEIVKEDPKWNKTDTFMEQQSKRSRGSGLVDVSDESTNIDLNADTYEIPDDLNDIKEISPP